MKTIGPNNLLNRVYIIGPADDSSVTETSTFNGETTRPATELLKHHNDDDVDAQQLAASVRCRNIRCIDEPTRLQKLSCPTLAITTNKLLCDGAIQHFGHRDLFICVFFFQQRAVPDHGCNGAQVAVNDLTTLTAVESLFSDTSNTWPMSSLHQWPHQTQTQHPQAQPVLEISHGKRHLSLRAENKAPAHAPLTSTVFVVLHMLSPTSENLQRAKQCKLPRKAGGENQ